MISRILHRFSAAALLAVALVSTLFLSPVAQATEVSGQSSQQIIIPIQPQNTPSPIPSPEAVPLDIPTLPPAAVDNALPTASSILPAGDAQPSAPAPTDVIAAPTPASDQLTPDIDIIPPAAIPDAADPYADSSQENKYRTASEDLNTLFSSYIDPEAPQVHSKYAILIDADTGSVLYEKNSEERAFPASTTKIMTCILVLENVPDLATKVTIGPEANGWSAANSLMGIIQGENITTRDLLYGLMLRSGNDAALALARFVGGSEDTFAAMMNTKAAELGMKNTHFVNPHGLTDENHYTTAADMAKLARYAMQNGDFRAIVSTKKHELSATNSQPARTITTTNRFLSPTEASLPYNWSACTGIKTGSTSAAQGCLVTSASYNNMNMIAVTFFDDSSGHVERWNDAKKMIEYGFNHFDSIDLGGIQFDPVLTTVENASRSDPFDGLLTLDVDASDMRISGLAAQINPIREKLSTLTVLSTINGGLPLEAPIRQGDLVGTAAIRMDNVTLAIVDLLASRDVTSNENDPQSAVTALFQSGGDASSKARNIPMYIFLGLGILVVVLFLVLLLRRRLGKQVNRRVKVPRRRYYNYYDRD